MNLSKAVGAVIILTSSTTTKQQEEVEDHHKEATEAMAVAVAVGLQMQIQMEIQMEMVGCHITTTTTTSSNMVPNTEEVGGGDKEAVEVMAVGLDLLLVVMALGPNHQFLTCTKRPLLLTLLGSPFSLSLSLSLVHLQNLCRQFNLFQPQVSPSGSLFALAEAPPAQNVLSRPITSLLNYLTKICTSTMLLLHRTLHRGG